MAPSARPNTPPARRGQQAGRSLRAAAQRTRGRVSDWGRQARSSATTVADRTRGAYQDHPLTMAALALMAGAAMGALLPRSRTEEETLGGAGGELARQARQTGGELAEKASRVAERAVQAGKDEAERTLRQETGSPQEAGSPSRMTH
ncbi:MAG: hypothetical protein NVV74_14100 [Magnetospirillum sp.]|nr:hypothetical protein [Magnetospirillum sp.]